MNTFKELVVIIMLSLVMVACAETPAPAPSQPTDTPASAAGINIPNLERGQTGWNEAQCQACHGPAALGGIGPQLASTRLPYDQFLHAVRAAVPPKPAYSEAQLSDQTVYNIYAWVRTQVAAAPLPAPNVGPATGQTPSLEEMQNMTIWTCRSCDTCHGVFAQGGPDGPTLAGINDPVEKELARMRRTAAKIPEHSANHISDEVFEKLYEWIKMGCVQDECSQ